MNALNPKVSLLIKLAEIVRAHHAFDPEVVEWYDRMAELEYVPARIPPVKVISGIESEVYRISGFHPGIYQPEWSPHNLTSEQINDAICSTERRGYQLFATLRGSSGEDASYTEAESVSEALEKCLQQFPIENGYIEHGVKDIETQEVIYFRPLESSGDTDSTSLNPSQTGFRPESDPEPLPLGETEPPPLSLD